MSLNHRKRNIVFSILLGVLTLLIIQSPLGQPIYADAPTSGHRSYWTPTNVTAPSDMRVLHVIFDGTDNTFKVGNKGLKACIDWYLNASVRGETMICHPVRNIPIGKNGTVDVGYFVIPKTNETLFASSQVDFNGIRGGTQIDGSEIHLFLPETVYSDVYHGIWCLKHQNVKVNTPAMSECIIRYF